MNKREISQCFNHSKCLIIALEFLLIFNICSKIAKLSNICVYIQGQKNYSLFKKVILFMQPVINK